VTPEERRQCKAKLAERNAAANAARSAKMVRAWVDGRFDGNAAKIFQARLDGRYDGDARSPATLTPSQLTPSFSFPVQKPKGQSPFHCNAIADREEGRFVLPPSHPHPMPRATALLAVVSPFAKANALKLSLPFHFSLHSFALSHVKQQSTVLAQRRGARLRPQPC
jgi:hypothetical protein